MRIPVAVEAADPISLAGVTGGLRGRPELVLVGTAEAQVTVVVADGVDDTALAMLRRAGRSRRVLIAGRIKEAELLEVVEHGVVAILWRQEATPDGIARAIESAARGNGDLPPDLLGRLLKQVRRLQRGALREHGFTAAGLAEREKEVLRLVADGFDTADIAAKLSYSERTVKNVLHTMMTRYQLKNRPHLVAYAVREGHI
ncbi:response regulator transcription factor [Actinomadura bangladeshensis]|uniref:Response regulator transcription factor n=2 Tax=Actinomadura bangladeshensis TaxID=453573 RepID=A0A4R4PA34_9ACTN|nr:response regulator transcription factor [Actinomadura bangladeshensis]